MRRTPSGPWIGGGCCRRECAALSRIVLLGWVACFGLRPLPARAQPPTTVLVVEGRGVTVFDGASEQRGRTWVRRVERSLPGPAVDSEAWLRRVEPVGVVSPERLEALSLIETLLVRARHAASRLQERDAVSILLRAESLAEAHLDVPGIAAWYAELQLALAVTATQAGLGDLGQAALRRSASVDSSRSIQAAEARPDVVERGRAAIQRARTGPRGRFEVRADVAGAVVFVDDQRLGATPRTVELPAGPHLLVVDAPGYLRYAQLIDVLEGERPAVEVSLSPTPRREALARLRTAARAGDVGAVTSTLAVLDGLSVVLVFAGGTAHDRAVLVRCDAGGCARPERVTGESLAVVEGGPSLSSALEWLGHEPEVVTTEPAWWEHWGFWAGVVGVLGFVVTAAAIAGQPDAGPPFVLEVDPGPLPTGEVD